MTQLETTGPINQKEIYRVLLVDDVPEILDLTAFQLGECGVSKIFTATSGEKALEILRTQSVELILTDIKMPHMDGETLLKKIKQLQLDPKPFVVAMTGGIETRLDKKSNSELSHLIDAYLYKPFKFDELKSIVHHAKEAL